MKRPQVIMITVIGHAGAVHGSLGVGPGLGGIEAGLCALFPASAARLNFLNKTCFWNGNNELNLFQ